MASWLFAKSSTSRLSLAERRSVSVACISNGKTALLSEGTAWECFRQRSFHFTGQTATRSPLTAWMYKTSYAIAALMNTQAKLVIPQNSLLLQVSTRKTATLFHCKPCDSKMTFAIYHPVTHSFLTSNFWLLQIAADKDTRASLPVASD